MYGKTIGTITETVVKHANDFIQKTNQNPQKHSMVIKKSPSADGGVAYYSKVSTQDPVVIYFQLPDENSQESAKTFVIRKIELTKDAETGTMKADYREPKDITDPNELRSACEYFAEHTSEKVKPARPTQVNCSEIMPPVVFSHIDPKPHEEDYRNLDQLIMIFAAACYRLEADKTNLSCASFNVHETHYISNYLDFKNGSCYVSKYDDYENLNYISGITLASTKTRQEQVKSVTKFFKDEGFAFVDSDMSDEDQSTQTNKNFQAAQNFRKQFMGQNKAFNAFEYIGSKDHLLRICDPCRVVQNNQVELSCEFTLPSACLINIATGEDVTEIKGCLEQWKRVDKESKKESIYNSMELSDQLYVTANYRDANIVTKFTCKGNECQGIIAYESKGEGVHSDSVKVLKITGTSQSVMTVMNPDNNDDGKKLQLPTITNNDELQVWIQEQTKTQEQPKMESQAKASNPPEKGKSKGLLSGIRKMFTSKTKHGSHESK